MVIFGGLELVVGGVIVNELYKQEKAKKEKAAEKRRPRRHSDEYHRPVKRRDSWERLKHKHKLPQKPVGQPLAEPKPQNLQPGPSSSNDYLKPTAPGMGRVGSAPPPGYYPANNLNAQYRPIPRPNDNSAAAQYGGYRYEGEQRPQNQNYQYPPPPQPMTPVPSSSRPQQQYYPPPPPQSQQYHPPPNPPQSQQHQPLVSPLSPASVASTTSTYFEPPAGYAELSSGHDQPYMHPPAGFVELPVGESSHQHPSRHHGRPARVHFEDGLDSEKMPVTPPPPYREY